MAYTKNRNWNEGSDGQAPVASRRFAAGHTAILIDGPNGEYFGYEDSDGNIYPVVLVTPSAAAVTARSAKATEVSVMQAEETARANTLATLKAKRENGDDMTQADINALADLFLGVDLT